MKIQDLLKQAKPCWKYAAMDWDGTWYLYQEKPYVDGNMLWTHECEMDSFEYSAKDVGNIFDVEPFDGDWKDSLICREEC